MSRATEEIMDKLHGAVADDLIKQIEADGDTPATVLNAAIKFLKDNGIETPPGLNSRVTSLAKSLPEFDDDGKVVPISKT